MKYRIGDMAKDFGMQTKEITALVTEFFEKPKSAQQILTEQQLNVLFDVITQRNQIASLEQVFAVAPAAPAVKEQPAPKAEPAKAPAVQSKPAKPEAPKEPERKRERRVIDTSAVTVNADRFDDRVDVLVSSVPRTSPAASRRSTTRSSSRTAPSLPATSAATRSRKRCAVCSWKLPKRHRWLSGFPMRSPLVNWLPV